MRMQLNEFMGKQETPTPPGEGSTTPVARPDIQQVVSDEEHEAGEGVTPMKTGEAVRRVMDEADSEEKVTGHRAKKSKGESAATQASGEA